MACIALYTCGRLRAGWGGEQVHGFFELSPSVFAAANRDAGCLGHIMDTERGWPPSEQDWGHWGEYAVPRFFRDLPPEFAERISATLSVWEDFESVRRFVYGGIHAAALKNRTDWFEKLAWPQYVMWWIADGTFPTFGQGVQRLELLFDTGPSPEAFHLGAYQPAP